MRAHARARSQYAYQHNTTCSCTTWPSATLDVPSTPMPPACSRYSITLSCAVTPAYRPRCPVHAARVLLPGHCVGGRACRPFTPNDCEHRQTLTNRQRHAHACMYARAGTHTHTHIHTLNSHTLSPTTSLSVILNLRLWWTFDLSGSTPTSTYKLVLPSPSERTRLATAGVSWG